MNKYVTGAMIKRLRKEKKLTQHRLADIMNVSSKTISKWETGKGYPDISLIEPLSSALGVSVIELFSGTDVINTNKAANMLRIKFYVCPICGNVIQSAGDAVVSCCGIVIPALEEEPTNDAHHLHIQRVEDEYYAETDHEMSKTHYISFIAAVSNDGCIIKKLYPQGAAQARFRVGEAQHLLFYCNQHGLFKQNVNPDRQKRF